ncbi:MAG: hypothetical protein ACJ74Z_24045 [Bryobacteraceae bacterium]
MPCRIAVQFTRHSRGASGCRRSTAGKWQQHALGANARDGSIAPIPAVRGTEIEWARLPEADLPISIPYRGIVDPQTTTAGVGPDTPEAAFQRLAAVNSSVRRACQTGEA